MPLLQAHLTSMSMLFVGLSFTDPNMRHVLSLIRESFTEAPPEHFAIVRPPHRDDFASDDEFEARAAHHRLWAKDLRRYGLLAIEIDDYGEVPELMRQIERRVAARRIWVSGSWPIDRSGIEAANLYSLAEDIGRWIGQTGRDLVSGGGSLIGSASIAGFLDALRHGGGWDLSRRLIARPFPQPFPGSTPDTVQMTALRRTSSSGRRCDFFGWRKIKRNGSRSSTWRIGGVRDREGRGCLFVAPWCFRWCGQGNFGEPYGFRTLNDWARCRQADR
jgi:hypothetical protein